MVTVYAYVFALNAFRLASMELLIPKGFLCVINHALKIHDYCRFITNHPSVMTSRQ